MNQIRASEESLKGKKKKECGMCRPFRYDLARTRYRAGWDPTDPR